MLREIFLELLAPACLRFPEAIGELVHVIHGQRT